MNNHQSAIRASFDQLVGAVESEIAELGALGQTTFHDVSPVHARGLLQRARRRRELRDCLAMLHSQWESDCEIAIHVPPLPPPPPPPAPMTPEVARRIKNISIFAAAEKLMVSEGRVIRWLEEGKLKGFRLTRGRWRIPEPEVVRFALSNRDLIHPAPQTQHDHT